MTKPAIVIIQARCSSSRLPNKVLKPLAGQPMIWHIVQRARACENAGHVVVATSVDPSDDALAKFCAETEIECYRGSLSNVLSRYLGVLEHYDYPYFVRITGDCPLIHPPFIDRQIQALITHDADLVRCDAPSTLLEGQVLVPLAPCAELRKRLIIPMTRNMWVRAFTLSTPRRFGPWACSFRRTLRIPAGA